MEKKNKIIVSIVGIFIILLALVGITYGYFLTQVQGNTNTNSISITTANLRLVYGDGTGLITAKNIMPNTTVDEKTFTVKNEGNATVEGYAVSLEQAYIEGIIPSIFERPQDFEITLICTGKDKSNNVTECNGFTGTFNNESMILTTNDIDEGETHSYSLVIKYVDPGVNQSDDMGKNLNLKVDIFKLDETVDITGKITGVNENYHVRLNSEPKISSLKKVGTDYYYIFKNVALGQHTLTVVDEDGNDIANHKIVVNSGQSANVGTTEIELTPGDSSTKVSVPLITASDENRMVNVTTTVEGSSVSTTANSIELFNPYEGNKNSLAYHIINNAFNNTLGVYHAEYSKNPKTIPLINITTEFESTLSLTKDIYGDSYYFRGNVLNNYVEFNNMCWRIIRIEGDGSVKVTLESEIPCEYVGSNTPNYRIGSAWSLFKTDSLEFDDSEGSYQYLITEWFDKKFKTDNEMNEAGKLLKRDSWCLGKTNDLNITTGEFKGFYCTTGACCDEYVRLLIFAEIALAGVGTSKSAELADETFIYLYLLNNNYLHGGDYFALLSPYDGINGAIIYDTHCALDGCGIRPTITFKNNTTITSGDGSSINPYYIKTNMDLEDAIHFRFYEQVYSTNKDYVVAKGTTLEQFLENNSTYENIYEFYLCPNNSNVQTGDFSECEVASNTDEIKSVEDGYIYGYYLF